VEVENKKKRVIQKGGVRKVKKIYRPTSFLEIKADKKERGVRRPNFKEAIKANRNWGGIEADSKKSWELFQQSLSIYKKKFPNNLT